MSYFTIELLIGQRSMVTKINNVFKDFKNVIRSFNQRVTDSMKDELVLTLCKVNSKNEPDIPGDEAKISSVTHARSNSFLIRHRVFFLYLAPSIQKLSKTVDCHIF